MIKQSINSFPGLLSLGIEKIPNEQFVYIEYQKKFYIKDNNTGMVAGKTIQDAITAGCLIEAGKRVCNPFSAAMFYNRNTSIANVIFISATGVMVGTELTIGTWRYMLTGGTNGNNCLFYGGAGINVNEVFNTVTLLTSTGILVQPEANIGTARTDLAAVGLDIITLAFGGEFDIQNWQTKNIVSIFNTNGILAQAESNIGITRAGHAGAKANLNALFYGGYTTYTGNIKSCTIISKTGTLVNETNNIGTARSALAGAFINNKCIFFGGIELFATGDWQYQVTIINEDGTLAQAENIINTNTVRGYHAAANVGVNALFYGGGNYGTSLVRNTASILTITGTLAQVETAVGTGRYGHAGASI